MNVEDELNNALERMKLEDKSTSISTSTPKTQSEPHTPVKSELTPPPAPAPATATAASAPQHRDELEEFYELFKNKLAIAEPTTAQNQTLVVLSPLSYKHVFSRSWVPKRDVATIVERPERIKASSLGIGAAMNEMPSRLKLQISSKRADLNSSHVSKVHGDDWGKRLYKLCDESTEKLAKRELEVPDDWHYGDIYLCQGTIDALEGNLGAIETTIDDLFNQDKQNNAFIALRPPGHHSHPCEPSGFCLINNIHIGIQYAAEKYGITHAVILDFDLHHGDGSQDIAFELNFQNQDDKPRIGYFSVHDINSFPTEKGYAAVEVVKNSSICLMGHDMAVWNVHLEDYKTEDEFNQHYQDKYSVLFEKAREFLNAARDAASITAHNNGNKTPFRPMIFLSAGFDASEFEMTTMQRHGAHVPTSFYNKFTRDSIKLANEYSGGGDDGDNCKVLSLLEGGYSDAALSTGVFAHLTGLADLEWKWKIDENVAKEFERGSKSRFQIGAAGTWVTEGVLLGRALWPSTINKQVKKEKKEKEKDEFITPIATPSRVLRDRSTLNSAKR